MNSMLRSFTKIDEELFEELEEILILSDTGAATASRLCDQLREKVRERGETDPMKIRELLAETAADMLRGGQELHLDTKPSVILVIGVNGVGKTTTIGKLAARFRGRARRWCWGRRTPSGPRPSTSWRSGLTGPGPIWSSIRRAPTRRPWCSIP